MNTASESTTSQNGCWTLEKVSGPHGRHFFAGYARACADGYLAYVKIFDHEPESVWESAAIRKVASRASRSHVAALTSAEALAMDWLCGSHRGLSA